MILCFLCALTAGAQTTNNDSSCDISVTPAATLLLPYFEVDLTAPPAQARTTLFTVINTSALPQIARATIWTDWAFPVLTFDVFLTGYDVASVNLYDVVAAGQLPGSTIFPAGALSRPNYANPNHAATVVPDCAVRPSQIPADLLRDVQAALTSGRPSGSLTCRDSNGAQVQVGSSHGDRAIGYVTLDVVASCSGTSPNDSRYFTSDLLFDNVLTGDWMSVTPSSGMGNYAAGSPLVHIRAVPEGGPAGTIVQPRLPYTFYGRFLSKLPQAQRTADRRQPLPSTFAARFFEGGTTDFQTQLAIWREAITGADEPCSRHAANNKLPYIDVVRFDEHENAVHFYYLFPPSADYLGPTFPVTSFSSTAGPSFPALQSPQGDVGGWLHLNLARYQPNALRRVLGAGEHQAWVTISMFAEGRYAGAFDAVPLQNGCSPVRPYDAQIGPQ